MADMHHYVTAISKVVSTQEEEEVVIRGHRLSDLIARNTYSESVFLMLAGRMPSKAEARTLDALMTACVDHGVTPAAMIGRAFASYGTSIPQAIAGGILLFGDIAGGAGDPLARLMKEGMSRAQPAGGPVTDATIQQIASRLVKDALEHSGGRMPGFGIPAHATDPRAPALLKVAQEQGAAGAFCQLLVAIEKELARVKGRSIPINLDGIVAALVLDFGFPDGCAAAFVMIARSYSTLAHHLEEKSQNTRWRHVPQEFVDYTGPMPAPRAPAESKP